MACHTEELKVKPEARAMISTLKMKHHSPTSELLSADKLYRVAVTSKSHFGYVERSQSLKPLQGRKPFLNEKLRASPWSDWFYMAAFCCLTHIIEVKKAFAEVKEMASLGVPPTLRHVRTQWRSFGQATGRNSYLQIPSVWVGFTSPRHKLSFLAYEFLSSSSTS
ncbi:hypothetical protein CROQUDRAFT_95724 [Cronartium quercuum f. sp. fusiforme G11]|uniref:Uncharacterized protein n=1 Tax=Cronartium quercuum f. sp. fusiforme G11 TaxID=708437 RepID=A0A9P6NHR7_9BASI|nr:hypothetical protein CROQUDRAFT_95724 [Cronartium quercuum f. sp. fusiforme G11]